MPGVDVFFQLVAAEQSNKSNRRRSSGTDGRWGAGLKAVRVTGGVTFAQCDGTTGDGMPEYYCRDCYRAG